MPGWSRQLLHRHHRRRQDERQQEQRATARLAEQLPVGPANRRGQENHRPDRGPQEREASSACGNLLTMNIAAIAATRIVSTMPTRTQSIRGFSSMSLMIGEYACCCQAAGSPKTSSAAPAPTNAGQHLERRDAADPHHRRRRVADDTARPTRVGRRDDAGQVADVDLLEERVSHRAADHRAGDVVEERGEHEDDHEEEKGALPIVGQHTREEPEGCDSSRSDWPAARSRATGSRDSPGSPTRASGGSPVPEVPPALRTSRTRACRW